MYIITVVTHRVYCLCRFEFEDDETITDYNVKVQD